MSISLRKRGQNSKNLFIQKEGVKNILIKTFSLTKQTLSKASSGMFCSQVILQAKMLNTTHGILLSTRYQNTLAISLLRSNKCSLCLFVG